MTRANDTQVRSELRSVMTRHRLDLTKTSFVCARGIVRMMGALRRQWEHARQPIHHSDVEALEQDMSRVRGVVRIYMDLKDWQRDGSGQWSDTRPVKRALGNTDAKKRSVTEDEAAPEIQGRRRR